MHSTWCTLLKFFISFIRCHSIHTIIQWIFRTCDHIFTAHSQTHPTWFILFVHVIDKNTWFSHWSKFPRYDIFVFSIRHYTWMKVFFCHHHILQALHRTQQFMGKFNQNWTKKRILHDSKNLFYIKTRNKNVQWGKWECTQCLCEEDTSL